MLIQKCQISSFLLHALILAFLWWVLGRADPASWVFGLPAVIIAAWASCKLETGAALKLSLAGLLRFVPLFIWESFRGGVDVVRRIAGVRVRIEPGFKEYTIRLPNEAERLFFAACISLLPGTLSVQLKNNVMLVHALDATIPLEQQVGRLELAVARLFSVPLGAPSKGQ